MDTRSTVKNILRVEALPTLPEVIHRILAISGDPMSSMRELAEVIGRDPALSANMLRLVNSAYFGFSRKINAVQDAGVLLGVKAVRAMALGTSVVSAIDVDGFDCRSFWAHSLAIAIATDKLAQDLEHPQADTAFMAGLLHDVGTLLLVISQPEKAADVYRPDADDTQPIREREMASFGVYHDQASGHVARHWRFELHLTRAVEEHHLCKRRPAAEMSELARLILLAEWVLAGRYSLPYDPPPSDSEAAEVALSMGYPVEMIRETLSGLDKALGIIDPLLSLKGES
jgi:HD-like signal output (HDOD) protein